MDGNIIHEKGVVRMTARQLSNLWLDVTDRCGAMDLIDVHQPDSFTEDVGFSVYARETEGTSYE